jgi:Na+-transporting NADH:ubiquinone oxidoreductase subunit NqrB
MTSLEVYGLLTFETEVVIQQVKIYDVMLLFVIQWVKIYDVMLLFANVRKHICNFIFFIMSMLYQKWMLKTVNLCKQEIKIGKLMESAKNW